MQYSSCQASASMPDDALDVTKMNVNPGGKQRVMRDGWWDTQKMPADWMREKLRSHPDFSHEKSSVEHEEKRHIVQMLRNCHCELNSMSMGSSKEIDTAKRIASIIAFQVHVYTGIIPAFKSVSTESIQKQLRN